MFKEINGKKALAIIIVIAIVFVIGFYIYINQKIETPLIEEPEKTLMQKQLEELNALKVNTEPLTEEETEEQLEELNALKVNTEPLTEEETEEQLEELNNLR